MGALLSATVRSKAPLAPSRSNFGFALRKDIRGRRNDILSFLESRHIPIRFRLHSPATFRVWHDDSFFIHKEADTFSEIHTEKERRYLLFQISTLVTLLRWLLNAERIRYAVNVWA